MLDKFQTILLLTILPIELIDKNMEFVILDQVSFERLIDVNFISKEQWKEYESFYIFSVFSSI